LTDKKGVQLIIDVIGKDYWEQNVSSLALDGRMVILAFMSGKSLVNQNKKKYNLFNDACLGKVADQVDLSTILRKRLTVRESLLK
jgi:NADPH2:quinone reductase